jgi:vitamin B12 transporter
MDPMKAFRIILNLKITCIVILLAGTKSGSANPDEIPMDPISVPAPSLPEPQPYGETQKGEGTGSTPAQALQQSPGFQLFRGGGSGQTTTAFFRGARSEHLQYRLDGILVNDPLSPSGGFDLSRWDSVPWKRVQVLSGPNPVLYGPGAMAGVVLLETEESSRISGAAGSYGRWEINGAWQGFFAGWTRERGFSAADEALGNTEPDSFRLWQVSAKKAVPWGPKTDLTLVTHASEGKTDTDSRGGPGGDKLGTFTRAYEWRALLGLVHRPDDQQTWSGNLQTQYFDRFDNSIRDSNFSSRQSEGELKHQLALSKGRFTSLLQGRHERGQSSDLDRIRQRGSLGLGLLWQHPLMDQSLMAEAGVRRDQFFPSGNAWSGQFGLNGWLEMADLNWQIKWGRATKAPSLYQLYSLYGSQGLKPETAIGWDGNVSKALGDWNIRLGGFFNDYRNMIDFDSSLSRFRSFARARTKGGDLRLRFEPGPFTFGWGTGYLSATDLGNGQALVRRPRWTGLGEFGFRKGAFAGGLISARYMGPRIDLDPISFERKRLPGFVSWDLHLFHRIRSQYQVDAYLENLGNRHFQTVSGFGNGGRKWILTVTREFL